MIPAPEDHDAVRAQLGREPRGRWTVARRCGCGRPQVLQTQPLLDDGTPFPTLYWLTCRKLSAQVGRLEATGWMADVNRRLSEDPEFHRRLQDWTRAYVSRRDEVHRLGPVTHPGGGPDRVKCLHAHTADQLAARESGDGENPVGAEVLAHLEWSDPAEPCV